MQNVPMRAERLQKVEIQEGAAVTVADLRKPPIFAHPKVCGPGRVHCRSISDFRMLKPCLRQRDARRIQRVKASISLDGMFVKGGISGFRVS
jgi:hypothetical protein